MLKEIILTLPDWFSETLTNSPDRFASTEERMRFILRLARENVLKKSGGPFAAGIFDSTGKIISAGINLVESNHCSIYHAEILAIALAQKTLGRYDISNAGSEQYELVSSTEPCAMCFGAIPWSGVRRLVCGARDEDARAIGFDEGPKLTNWKEELEKRNIRVYCDILRSEAVDVLNLYVQQGGTVYNAG
jgi:tRNA(Arg) A34 adenosine deaminase TadA